MKDRYKVRERGRKREKEKDRLLLAGSLLKSWHTTMLA